MAQNTFPASASVSIASTTANVSSFPDTKSTGRGMLIPGMKNVQAKAIVLPEMGLLNYRTVI